MAKRTRRVALAVLWLSILAFSVSAVACKGGSSTSSTATTAQGPTSYFDKLAAITQDAKRKEGQAQPQSTVVANVSPAELKQAGLDFLNTVITVLDGERTQIQDLTPPPEWAGQHEALIKELSRLIGTLRSYAEQARSVPDSDILSYLRDTVFAPATFEAFDAACDPLQAAARNAHARAEVDCPGRPPSATPSPPAP